MPTSFFTHVHKKVFPDEGIFANRHVCCVHSNRTHLLFVIEYVVSIESVGRTDSRLDYTLLIKPRQSNTEMIM